MRDLDSEALDFRAASESFMPVRSIVRRDLETLRLVTDHQRHKVPTVGGVPLFGRDRQRHFPDAWIKAGRFRGTDKSRIFDRTEIRSHPVQAIEEAIAFVQKHGLHRAGMQLSGCREPKTLRALFGPSMGLVNSVLPAVLIDAKVGEIVEKASHASRTTTGHAKRLLARLSTWTRAT